MRTNLIMALVYPVAVVWLACLPHVPTWAPVAGAGYLTLTNAYLAWSWRRGRITVR